MKHLFLTLNQQAKAIADNSNGELSKEEVKAILSIKWKYSTEKHSTSNRGQEIEAVREPLFYETRSDKDGAYLTVFCVLTDRLKAHQVRTNEKILKIWNEA